MGNIATARYYVVAVNFLALRLVIYQDGLSSKNQVVKNLLRLDINMSWSVGYDSSWKRDIGYGVPSICDHPDCNEEINRGLSYVCGGSPYGGDRGCGLFFCEKHRAMRVRLPSLCERCAPRKKEPFEPKPDMQEWVQHKLTHESWQQWRDENPDEVKKLKRLGNEF